MQDIGALVGDISIFLLKTILISNWWEKQLKIL